ncbi:hypothetical protein [Winogradskyella sp.]
MIKDLIVDAFKKGKEALINEGVLSPSDTAVSELIATFINEDCKTPIHPRTIRNYYKNALNNPEEDINISRTDIVKSLCQFLDFESYQEYLNQKSSNKKVSASYSRTKKYIIISAVIIGVIFSAYALFIKVNEPRFMIWNIDHYEEVGLDLNKYKLGDLKVYKQERIDKFRKIQPDCNYPFFNSDGYVRIWYGKNDQKEYEFFTDLGLHPRTGKTLKPITDYIIEKYICP